MCVLIAPTGFSISVCDAVVAAGHPFSYLPDEEEVERAFVAAAEALRRGGVLAVDICDLEWGLARQHAPNLGRAGEDWAIITEFSSPSPERFVRQMAVFVRNQDGSWRRDDERHYNVLIGTTGLPLFLTEHHVEAIVTSTFGAETLPVGLRSVVGHR